jgi:hypothetical protein
LTTAQVALALLALAACRTRVAATDLPARLVNPTARSHEELVRVVSRALRRATVTIADDALTRASTLVIERAPARDPLGRPLNGRERGRPEHFRLVRNGSSCVLVHEATGRRFTLKEATCLPE